MMTGHVRRQFIPLFAVLLISVLILGLLVAGHFYFKSERNKVLGDQMRQMKAMSAGQVRQIETWLEERKAEGLFFAANPDFKRLIARLAKSPGDTAVTAELAGFLEPIIINHQYDDAVVLDREGNCLFGFYGRETDSGRLCRESVEAMYHRSDTIFFGESHNTVTKGRFFIDLVVPADNAPDHSAVVVLRINPYPFLVSLLKQWPHGMNSGEHLLARYAGDSVVYFWGVEKGIQSGGYVPAVSHDAVSHGISPAGTLTSMETHDYRGVRVLAEVQKFRQLPWFLVAKVDLDEVYAPTNDMAVKVILYLLAFMVIVIISTMLLWKQQQSQNARKEMEIRSETARAYEKVRYMNALLSEVNDAIITFDTDLIIQSWNKGAERIYGWKAEEVVGKYGGGSLRVDFPGMSVELILSELKLNGFWKGEVIHKRKDGSSVYLISHTSHLKDDYGNVLGIITVNKDISEIVRSEKVRNAVYRISELAITTNNLDEMYTSIHVVIGELMDARNLFIALIEPQNQLSYPYFVDEKDPKPAAHLMGNGLAEYVIRTGTPLLAKPDDIHYMSERGIVEIRGTVPVDWLGIPLKIENEIIGLIAIQSYTPDIRYGEKEKEILGFVSEQIALSIHRKQIQQELIDAKQKAEVANKLTTALLSNMNHELRTPMNGILGFAEILMNDLHDTELRSKAENILTSGRRLMDTLDAIMDLSFLQSDKVTRKMKPVHVARMLQPILNKYEPAVLRKGLTLQSQIPDDISVQGDPQLFQHLMRNLIDNAVKYTEKGGITVNVSHPDEETRMVRIVVKDTGMGISPENHRMIFDAFRQVSEGYGRKFEGSGLGLTICKRIVDLFHGDISVASEFGVGSEFSVMLPAAFGQVAERLMNNDELLKTREREPSGSKLPDVLVVEDNLVNVQLLMIYSRKYCNIHTTTDARSAIQLTRERKFDAIFMDINLGPGLDGIQAMLEIRKRPDYRNVPILAVTGYASIGDKDRLLSIGFTGYIPKPFDRETIAEVMTELFGKI